MITFTKRDAPLIGVRDTFLGPGPLLKWKIPAPRGSDGAHSFALPYLDVFPGQLQLAGEAIEHTIG